MKKNSLIMQHDQYKQVYEIIKRSEVMEYSWYRRKDLIKHTGIVISFDGAQSITLDFFADTFHPKSLVKIGTAAVAIGSTAVFSPFHKKSKKLKQFVGSMKLKGKMSLGEFSGYDKNVVGKLIELPLTTKEEKENAINMFIYIAQLNLDDYQLMENNCRNHVITVASYLSEYPEMKGEDWSEFEFKMQRMLSDDQRTFQDLKNHALNYISKNDLTKFSLKYCEDEKQGKKMNQSKFSPRKS